MARHQFRSQPALQRSGERHHSLVAVLGLLAALGIATGAVINQLAPSAPGAPATYPGSAMDRPATAPSGGATDVAAVAPEPTAPLIEAPATTQIIAETPRIPPPVVKVNAAKPLRRAAPPRPPPIVAVEVAAPEPTWEEQRDEYVRARAVYDASERNAGFDWARQNKVRVARHCSVASQRTPAFVEGCMSYLAAGRRGAAAKPRDPADQG